MISIQKVRDHATTYIGQPTRASEDATNLKLFFCASLMPDLLVRLLGCAFQYTVNGEEDGPTVLRVLISLIDR